jgi:hypothetical protein
MTTINPQALISAQLYGGTGAAQRQPATAPERQRPAGAPRFHVEDEVSLRSADAPTAPQSGSAAPDKQSHVAPSRPRRPGALVDVTA